jgi:phospholipid-binding lipoprotein MlaA
MKISRFLLLSALSLGLAGCATTGKPDPRDPLESVNRAVFEFNEAADKAIAKPVATAYVNVMPVPARMMVGNFFSNLEDVVITFNDLMQFKFTQAASDATRVFVNSTLGIFGLVDVASLRLEKHNEDFGQTLGYWGLGTGPYLMLPLVGPSNLRDGVGLYADSFQSPLYQMQHMRTRNQLYVAKLANRRGELLEQEKLLGDATIDRYTFIRDAYLNRRQSLVYDGNPPHVKDEDEDFGEDEAPATEPAATPSANTETPPAAPVGNAPPTTPTLVPLSNPTP